MSLRYAVKVSPVLLLVTLAGWGCSDPLTPVMPEWDVDLNIPITSQTWTMEDMLKDDSLLSFSSTADNMLIVQRRYPIDRILLGDALRLDDVGSSVREDVGSFRFDIDDVVDRRMTVGEFFPSLPQGSGAVPAIESRTETILELDASASFTAISFTEGQALLVIDNGLPVPITFPEPVALYDAQRRLLAHIPITGEIAPHGSRTLAPVSLAGLTLQSHLLLGLRPATPGSGGASAIVLPTDYIRVRASFRSTRVNEAQAIIPAQVLEYQEHADLFPTGNGSITHGTAESGSIAITIANHLSIAADVDVTLHDATIAGMPIVRTVAVPSHGTVETSISVAGAELTPTNGRILQYTLGIHTRSTAPNHVMLRSTDSVTARAVLREVTMRDMEGVLPPQPLHVNQQALVDLTISDRIVGDVDFQTVRMWALITNATAFPGELTGGAILARAGQNLRRDSISLPAQTIPARMETRVDFDEQRVTGFFNAMDTREANLLDIRADLMLNRQGIRGTATAHDSLAGTLFLEFPMQVAVHDGSVTDTTDVSMSASTRDRLVNVKEGLITFVIENRLPAGVVAVPQLLDASGTVLLEPVTVAGSAMTVDAAPVDARGYSTSTTRSTMQMHLTGEEFRRVAATTQARMRLRIATTGSAPVVFRTTDFVRLRAFATITAHSTAILK